MQIDDEPATEKQLKYASDLGIPIHPHITKTEIGFLISLKVNHDKLASDRHKQFAREYGLEPPPEIGKKELFDLIKWEIDKPGREIDLIAWFTFRVYRHLMHGHTDLQIDSPHHPIILEIANHLVNSPAIKKSIQKYRGRSLIFFGEFIMDNGQALNGGSVQTIAYRETSAILREKLHIKTYAPTKQRKNIRTDTKKSPLGCLILILMVLIWLIFFKK